MKGLIVGGMALVISLGVGSIAAAETCQECEAQCEADYQTCSYTCVIAGNPEGCEEDCQNQEWVCIQTCWVRFTWWCLDAGSENPRFPDLLSINRDELTPASLQILKRANGCSDPQATPATDFLAASSKGNK